MRPSRLRHPVGALKRARYLPHWVRRADVAAARRINSRHVHPYLDRGLTRLSRAADHSALWFAIAGIMLLFGRKRPAARGIASLVVASVLSNLVGKQLFGGDRPLLEDVPVGRHLKKHPTSPSFPSGHSASAAGFATGVALEWPAAGLALAPVAGAVAYSRMHTGAHWMSDVVGGVGYGIGVAIIGKLLFPARQKRSHPAGPRVSLPTSPDGEGVLIFVNPASGSGIVRHPDPSPLIACRLPLATVRPLEGDEDLATVALAAIEEADPVALGICGGDGSVGTIAQLARERSLPLLVLPGGTFNHFARSVGVESADEAIDALQAGHGVRVDVAKLTFGDGNPITVLNTASIGIYPEFVAERERREHRYGKWLAAVLAAVRALRSAEPVQVEVNGTPATVLSLFIGVGGGEAGTAAPLKRSHLDDGVLDVRILHVDSRSRAFASLAFGRRWARTLRLLRLAPRSAEIESFHTELATVVVHPRQGQRPGFAHDGEVAMDPPSLGAPRGGYTSVIRLVPGGLQVYSPHGLSHPRRPPGRRRRRAATLNS